MQDVFSDHILHLGPVVPRVESSSLIRRGYSYNYSGSIQLILKYIITQLILKEISQTEHKCINIQPLFMTASAAYFI